MNAPKVVIIGAGFGGLRAARDLSQAAVNITLLDKHSYHMFTPLLYQVATASLSTGEVAVPIRSLFRGRNNVRCLMTEVESVDLSEQQVVLRDQNTPRLRLPRHRSGRVDALLRQKRRVGSTRGDPRQPRFGRTPA